MQSYSLSLFSISKLYNPGKMGINHRSNAYIGKIEKNLINSHQNCTMKERYLKCNSCPFITKYQRGKTWLYNNRAPGCVLLLLVGIQNRFVCGLVITVITRMLRLLLLANSFPHPHTQKGTVKKPTYTTITMKISYIHIQFPSILSHKKKASFVFFPFGLC